MFKCVVAVSSSSTRFHRRGKDGIISISFWCCEQNNSG
ncbi:MAG: hypothetical protein ACI8RD_011755, partial [Bacillariaceae sp.]